ncbi:SDR family NAD(P)-dependent oxidoreductase [Subtercola sp. YIM 133946]|uniref:SDR family NAD(P)-dependent oxidoreductase n=1 Tax=Subtercola sp. YIM 133946 TaxID=3118909 RepID=UPI002F91CCE5
MSDTTGTKGRLEGKVAIVTGAGSGMGEAIAKLFASEGASVALVDMSEAGERVADEIRQAGGTAQFWTMNVTDEARVEQVFGEVFERFGALNILINNAGVAGPTEPTDKVAFSDWETVFRINAGGPFLCTKHAIPYLRQTPGQTSIVNMSSIYAIIGNADVPVYHATKAAVRTMTKTDAITYAAEGIRVNAILPGTILTPMNLEKARQNPGYLEEMQAIHPLGTIGEPNDIAYAMLFLASDESKFTTGSELVIDGGFTAQ